ncbi:helix-turn-helix transcriptional regulator [bacterium]|nr:helix-turn-helix transcriptional regulator [bacterium]
MKTIGERIKLVRQTLGKSQAEIAEELNVTKQAISNIENGKCAPSIALLSKLLIDYSVNLNYIIGEVGSMYETSNNSYGSIKEAIMNEVEKMLIDRGIQ